MRQMHAGLDDVARTQQATILPESTEPFVAGITSDTASTCAIADLLPSGLRVLGPVLAGKAAERMECKDGTRSAATRSFGDADAH